MELLYRGLENTLRFLYGHNGEIIAINAIFLDLFPPTTHASQVS